MMLFHKLKYFIEVAHYKSYTKAANQLFISQPALSKQMKLLEEELGFTLFNRSSQGVELTSKGNALYHDLDPLFKNIDKTVEHHQNNGIIRFGSTPLLSSYFLHEHYEKLQYTNIYVTAIEDDSQDLLPLLKRHEIDAAIIQDIPHTEGLYSKHLFQDVFVAAVPSSYSLASKKEITMKECFSKPQITTPKGSRLYNQLQCIMEDYPHPEEIFETHYHAMAGFVSLGMGIAYVPGIMANHIQYKGITFLPIKGEPLKREMYLYSISKHLGEMLSEKFSL